MFNRSNRFSVSTLFFFLLEFQVFHLWFSSLSSDGDDIPLFILENHYITRDGFACIHISENSLVEGVDPVFFFLGRGGEWPCQRVWLDTNITRKPTLHPSSQSTPFPESHQIYSPPSHTPCEPMSLTRWSA